jgi:hypothetical protein
VCVKASRDDFLVALTNLLCRELYVQDEYDEVKRRAAEKGVAAYWHAKDRFLRRLIRDRNLRPS